MNEHRIRIGKQLANIRKEQGLTCEQAAEKIGSCKQTINKIELGKWSVGLDLLEKYASALGAQVTIERVAE